MKFSAAFIGHGFLILITLYFTYQIFSTQTSWIFLDNLNLLIHEAGHLIFLPLGEFMHVLGGSLLQVILPCSFFIYFLLKEEYFSASFILFWIADNIINVSVYMRDAQVMQLPLLGGDGVIHDWNWLFTAMGFLRNTQLIGQTVFIYGEVILICSIVGMVWFTYFDLRTPMQK